MSSTTSNITKGYLTLANGTTFEGQLFGKKQDVTGQLVFTTGMTGYLETATNPSTFGQVVVQTFPLSGNYGAITSDCENLKQCNNFIGANAFIAKYPCQEPSNFRSEASLDTFFMERGITGLSGIDTRQLTKIIREAGEMACKITTAPPADNNINLPEQTLPEQATQVYGSGKYTIALLNLGAKQSTVNALVKRNCTVHVLPRSTSAEAILKLNPHGLLISSGPGNPNQMADIVQTIQALKAIPTFAIGLGHQLLALANGHSVTALKVGHRGTNQPVKDMATGKLYITHQHHGYVVQAPNPAFVNVNDGTCEGLVYENATSVQFYPCSGPKDTLFLYDRFVERIAENATR